MFSRTNSKKKSVSLRSMLSLDLLNATVADMRDGVGPYLALFLLGKTGAESAWNPSQIGWALAAASTATLVSTAFAGSVFDSSTSKRRLIIFSFFIVACLTALMVFTRGFWPVIGLQVGLGLACAFIGPGIAALSLGLVGRNKMNSRIGRNETFNHAGNFLAAIAAAALARSLSIEWVFYLVIFMSFLSIGAALAIPRAEIDDLAARDLSPNVSHGSREAKPILFSELASNQTLMLSLLVIVAFQFANACLLPIAAQVVSHVSKNEGVRFLSSGMIVAQLVAMPTAWFTGVMAQKYSPRVCLIVGLLAVLTRTLIFATCNDVNFLIGAQVFDGIAAGVMAVAPLLLVCQITQGSGRFTFLAGVLATAVGLGASASNVVGGYLLEAIGGRGCFLFMAGIAAFALTMILTLILKAPDKNSLVPNRNPRPSTV